LEGSGCGLIEALSRNLPGGTEENLENPKSGQAGVQGGIRTEHLPNTRLERYRYTHTRHVYYYYDYYYYYVVNSRTVKVLSVRIIRKSWR
jgi:hypothetical protein